jgi:hypothetical protein
LLRKLPQRVDPRSLAFMDEAILFEPQNSLFGICFVIFVYAAVW